MKIYFAYRTGYEPNHRKIEQFESGSILNWFQENWTNLCQNEEKVLGFKVYGFPIFLKENENTLTPSNLKILEEILSSKVYNNQITVQEDNIICSTDDDEIMLAWAIFTQDYAEKNPEKVAIWLNNGFPTDTHNEVYTGEVDGINIKTKGNENCRTYYMATTIYDGGHLEDLSKPVIFERVSLPNLPELLAKNNFFNEIDHPYRKDEIMFLQQFAKLLSAEKNLSQLYSIFSRFSQEELSNITYNNDFSATITSDYINKKSIDSKTICLVSEHLVEISIHWFGFFDYIVLFDDYWFNKNPELAKSIINFHKNEIL